MKPSSGLTDVGEYGVGQPAVGGAEVWCFVMTSLRTEAESLARALELGLLDVADVVHWADCKIEQSEVPEGAICDVAMAASKYPQDVASILRGVRGDCDDAQSIQLVLRYALNALEQAKRDGRQIACALFHLAYAGNLLGRGLEHGAFSYWDDIDLARDGYSNQTEKQITAAMTSAIKDFLGADEDA